MPLRFAVIGQPIEHSLSPYLHNYLLREIGEDGQYERREVAGDALTAALAQLKGQGFRGFNITIPHKQAVLPLLQEVSEQARVIGAVNTVLINESGLAGFNTDHSGFSAALAHHSYVPQQGLAAVLGAGGAARAVIFSLAESGARRIVTFGRTHERAVRMAAELSAAFPDCEITAESWDNGTIMQTVRGADLLVNATPVGMWPAVAETPLQIDFSCSHLVAADLIYNPLRTNFLLAAEAHGAKIVDGLDMFIFQGTGALKIWLGRDFDFGFRQLRAHLIKQLEEHGKH